jgi:hypothetical protein
MYPLVSVQRPGSASDLNRLPAEIAVGSPTSWVLHMKRSAVAGFTNEYLVVGDTSFRDFSKVSSVVS